MPPQLALSSLISHQSMEIIGNSSREESSHTRSSQACHRCRTLKTKCVPSEQAGTCQRCFKSKRECVWVENRQRTKRPNGQSRISQLEQKIDGLMARVVDADAFKHTPSSLAPPATPALAATPQTHSERSFPPSTTPQSRHDDQTDDDAGRCSISLEELGKIHSFDFHGSDRSPSSLGRGNPSQVDVDRDPTFNCELVKGLLESAEAEVLLNEYRPMADSFPFVPIASNTTALELQARKPMLLLAILAAASWKNRALQVSLEQRYRHELASRTIIRPRKCLSLIQSILVYLSWCHYFLNQRSPNILTMLHLAISLVSDLGLDSKSRGRLSIKPLGPPSSSEDEREKQRTLLGCYYLSSAIASGLQKPNLFKYTSYMSECGRRLKKDREFGSDEILLSLIGARQMDDQIYDNFLSEDSLNLPTSDSRLLMQLRLMETQMDEWKRETQSETYHRLLDLSFNFSVMELHSVAIRRSSGPNENPMPYLSSSNNPWLNILLLCLEAGKSFLDTFLAIPPVEYHRLSFMEWMRLGHTFIVMSRVSIPNENHHPEWDAKVAQEYLRLDLGLECLCYRMQMVTKCKPSARAHPDFWMAMKMIISLLRAWYIRKIRSAGDISTTSATSNATSHSEAQIFSTKESAENTHSIRPVEMPWTQRMDSFAHGATDTMDFSDFDITTQPDRPPMVAPMMDLDFDIDRLMETWSGGGLGNYDLTNFGDGW